MSSDNSAPAFHRPTLTMFLLFRSANTIRNATRCTTYELRNTLSTCDVHDDITDCNAVDLHSNTSYVLFDCPLPLIKSVWFKLCSAVSFGSMGHSFIPRTNVQFDKNLNVPEYKSFHFFTIKLTFIILHFVFSYAYSLLLF